MCLLFLLTGCGVCRRCPQGTVQRDSIYVTKTETVIQHDTTILWRIPEGSDSAVLPDTDTSRLRTGLAESEAWVKDGQLHHLLRNRSDLLQPIRISIPEKASTESSRLVRTVTVEVERELSWWQRLWIQLGRVFAGLLAAVALYVVIKIIR